VIVGIVVSSMIKFGGILVLVGSLRFKIFGMILVVCATGYLFTYLQSILHSTAAEEREMPDLAGISFVEDVFVPFLRFLGLALFCFGPAIGVGLARAPAPAILATAIFGALYFPMAFLAVAILDSVGAANPLVVVPSMVKVPLEYLATLILLGVVLGVRPVGDFLIGKVFPEGFLTHSMGELVAMVAALAFWAFVSFYLLIVAVHILGLLYVAKKDKLAWLAR